MVRHIDEALVHELLPMSRALDAVERALRARADSRAHDVPRTAMRLPEGSLRVLAAAAPELGLLASKATFSTGTGSGRGYLSLIDLRSGELVAIIESMHLSRMRTGAASGIATRLLARAGAERLAVLGAGSQAMAQIEAVCAVRPIRTVNVWSRDAERLRRFCARASAVVSRPVSPVESAREAVAGADIVTLITSAREPVIEGRWLEPGQHVNAAGSNALDRRELDGDAIGRCDRIVVDAREVARRECGDLLPLAERGLLDWDELDELGDVLTGRARGRSSDAEITLFESHGMGVQDLYAAQVVDQAARLRESPASPGPADPTHVASRSPATGTTGPSGAAAR
jgi:ornithine cyclodeaminase